MFGVVISTGDGEDMPSLLFKILFLHTPALGEPAANLALCFENNVGLKRSIKIMKAEPEKSSF